MILTLLGARSIKVSSSRETTEGEWLGHLAMRVVWSTAGMHDGGEVSTQG